MSNKFNFYSDAGHGWLAVKKQLVWDLGLADAISQCSYEKGKTVYLEEDCDAPKFLKAYENNTGCQPTIVVKRISGQSRIRSYQSYRSLASYRDIFKVNPGQFQIIHVKG